MNIITVKELENIYLVNGVDSVPKNPDNSDYKKIQKWIADGGNIEQEDSVAISKANKINQVTNARKVFQYSDIVIGNNTYINTETAQNKFFNLFLGAVASDFPLDWRLADLSWVKLSKDNCLALELAIIAKEKSAYQQETDLINQINACTTLEELESIDIAFE